MDGGVDTDHEDLQSKLESGYNVVDPLDPPEDSAGHGTKVAGIAAAYTNNSDGIAGVGYNCKIIPVKWSNDYTQTSQAASAINGAWNNGADVINCSWYTNESAVVENAITSATTYGRSNKGCVFVKSAGNDGPSDITFTGKHPRALTVGASTSSDYRASYSSKDTDYGKYLDVLAPSYVYTTTMGEVDMGIVVPALHLVHHMHQD